MSDMDVHDALNEQNALNVAALQAALARLREREAQLEREWKAENEELALALNAEHEKLFAAEARVQELEVGIAEALEGQIRLNENIRESIAATEHLEAASVELKRENGAAKKALVIYAGRVQELERERDQWAKEMAGENQMVEEARNQRNRLRDRVEELEAALREIEPVLDELIGWINTDLIGCIEVEQRGEAARLLARRALEPRVEV